MSRDGSGQTLSNSDIKPTELKPRSISDLPSREPLSKAGKICDEGHSFVVMGLNMDSANTHRTGALKTESNGLISSENAFLGDCRFNPKTFETHRDTMFMVTS
jgi:hypothetical protein